MHCADFNAKPRKPSPKRKGFGLYDTRNGGNTLLATNATREGIRRTACNAGLGDEDYEIRPVKMAAAWEGDS